MKVPAETSTLTDLENFYLVSQFYALEARLLDERRFAEWLEFVDDDVLYEVPNRMAKMEFAAETSPASFRIRDDKKLLAMRVARLTDADCWSETPPSRTVRVVGSIHVQVGGAPGILEVDSGLILYRQRGTEALGDIIPVRRQDKLRVTEDGLRILYRKALIGETALSTPNLGVFL